MGSFLLQKHCLCDTTVPDCFNSSWRVTSAGSKFLSLAEKRHAPVKSEDLAIACGLEQTKYFAEDCDNFVVVNDHKRFVKIFCDWTLDEITNTRLFRLKQRTLLRRIEIFHMPELSNQAADAASRHLVSCNFIATVSPQEHDSPDVIEQALVAAIQRETSENVCLQWRDILDRISCEPTLSKYAMKSSLIFL